MSRAWGATALLANPAVRQAYDAQAPELELARELIAARTKAGLTQGDVAARMGTTQSVVARIESGFYGYFVFCNFSIASLMPAKKFASSEPRDLSALTLDFWSCESRSAPSRSNSLAIVSD